MLVKKGAISRNIDPRRLDAYKAKGFVPVNAPADGKAKQNAPAKQAPKATADE